MKIIINCILITLFTFFNASLNSQNLLQNKESLDTAKKYIITEVHPIYDRDRDVDPEPCARISNVQQTCNEDGTVTIDFDITVNSPCKSSKITIITNDINGQAIPFNPNGASANSMTITTSGVPQGTQSFFQVLIYGPRGLCCKFEFSIDVIPCQPCELEASLVRLSCTPEASANIFITGGTPPYIGPPGSFEIATTGNFNIEGLDPGTHNLTFMDSNGCSVTEVITVPDYPEVLSIETTPVGCGIFDFNAVQIIIGNGSPPYYGPNNHQSVDGEFVYTFLDLGEYEWIFYDSNGCEVIASFTIELTVPNQYATCQDFEDISIDITGEDTDFVFSETLISGISAVLNVRFGAENVTDQFIMTINGDEVANWSLGLQDCEPQVNCWTAEGNFCINPCDAITFTVNGNICHTNEPTNFKLTVFCEEGECPIPTPDPGPNCWEPLISYDDISSRNSNSEISNTVRLFPNPVTDVLNITHSEPRINFQSAKIFNSSGIVIYSENISSSNQLKIDVSTFSEGIYIVEIIDNSENKIIERFMKI